MHFAGGFAGRPGPSDTFGNSTGYLAGQGEENSLDFPMLNDGQFHRYTLLPETRDHLTLEVLAPASPALAVFPPVAEARVAGRAVKAKRDGIFQRFNLTGPATATTVAECDPLRSAAATTNVLSAMDESVWTDAAAVDFKAGTTLAQVKAVEGLERRRIPLVLMGEHVNIPDRGPSG